MWIAIYGAGNGGHLFADVARKQGHQIYCFIDDHNPEYCSGETYDRKHPVLLAIFDNKTRLKLKDKFDLFGLAHESLIALENVFMGRGTLIKPGVILSRNVKIGEVCIIDSGVIIEHETVVEDGCFISVGSNIGSGVTIGKGTLIGIGCNIQSGVKIGKNCVICSGATIFQNVPDNTKMKVKL